MNDVHTEDLPISTIGIGWLIGPPIIDVAGRSLRRSICSSAPASWAPRLVSDRWPRRPTDGASLRRLQRTSQSLPAWSASAHRKRAIIGGGATTHAPPERLRSIKASRVIAMDSMATTMELPANPIPVDNRSHSAVPWHGRKRSCSVIRGASSASRKQTCTARSRSRPARRSLDLQRVECKRPVRLNRVICRRFLRSVLLD